MGDLIHTLPALTDAQKAYQDIHFDWVAEEAFAEIPGWHPAVAGVIKVAIRRWRKNFLQTLQQGEICAAIRQIRQHDYDYVIDAQGLLKSAAITLMAKGVRCGVDRQSSRESLAAIAYRQCYRIPDSLHAIDRWRMLFARVLGHQYDRQVLDYGINPQPAAANDQQPYLVFLHGTSRDTKLWPLEEWIALAKLAQQDFTVYLPWGSHAELQRAAEIARQVACCKVLPKMNLGAIARLLAGAAGVVGVDTGLAHLSAALDVPGVAIYTETSPDLVGACGRRQLCITEQQYAPDQVAMAGLHKEYNEHITAEIVWKRLNLQIMI